MRPSTETPYQCFSNLLFGTSLLDQADQIEKKQKINNSWSSQVPYSVCFTLALRQFRRKPQPVPRPSIFSFENVERAYKNREGLEQGESGMNITETVTKKNALYLSVNVFSTKVLIGDTIFTFPNGDRTAILRGHPSHAKV